MSRPRWRRGCFLALTMLGFVKTATPAGAAVFYVGVGTGCTHATLALAVAAAAANGPDLDFIRLATPSLNLGAVVDVNNQSVQVIGGFPDCTTAIPTARTLINQPTAGADGFWVHGAGADERFFGLTNISVLPGAAAGRAVLVQGLENVLFDNVVLDGGQADYGGNLRMQGAVFVQLVNQSSVRNGLATTGSGGGIHCENGGELLVDGSSEVRFNVAQQNGGGLFGFACTLESRGLIELNDAHEKGGGIYAAGASTVRLIGGNLGDWSILNNNSADQYGGGLFLVDAGTTAVARNAAISNNSAGSAGGVWVGVGGTSFTMDVDDATCSIGRDCSWLNQNFSVGGSGGALLVAGGSSATIRQTKIEGNYIQGGGVGSVADVIGTLLFESCEIFYNFSDDDANRFYVTGTLTVAFSTIDEPTATEDVFWVWAGSSFKLLSSIVQASQTFHAPPVAAQIDCVITQEQGSFPGGGTFLTIVTDPTTLFLSPGPPSYDYRLKRGSVAEDYCDNVNYSPTDGDIENQTRPYDDPTDANLIGPYDLGADEWQPGLFSDGFESGNSLRWSNSVP